MTARTETNALQHAIFTRTQVALSFDDANTLRRAQITLHHWGEQECGDGNDYCSWSIERDEATQIPYLCTYPHNRPMYRRRIADKENGALRRVDAVCLRVGLYFYHQTDPRGCALYVANEPLTDSNYSSRSVECCN